MTVLCSNEYVSPLPAQNRVPGSRVASIASASAMDSVPACSWANRRPAAVPSLGLAITSAPSISMMVRRCGLFSRLVRTM
jgi:hypothetical protein